MFKKLIRKITIVYFFRSELYSPNKSNGSDIYGSKSEFVFPSQHHHHHPHNRGGYYSTANNGPSSRPNSIYSPSGTLTRLGSKVSGCSIKNAGGQTPTTANGCCEESGNFYESDSGVSSLYEPLSFCGGGGVGGGSLLMHSTSQHRLDFLAAGGSLHGHQNLPQAAGDFNRYVLKKIIKNAILKTPS